MRLITRLRGWLSVLGRDISFTDEPGKAAEAKAPRSEASFTFDGQGRGLPAHVLHPVPPRGPSGVHEIGMERTADDLNKELLARRWGWRP